MSNNIEWSAVTASGSHYVGYSGYVERWDGERLAEVLRPWVSRVSAVPTAELTDGPWVQDSVQWEKFERPVVGRRMYFGGRESWRLTSEVVDVAIFEGVDS